MASADNINGSSVTKDEHDRLSPISRWADRMLTDFQLNPEKLHDAIFWYFMFSPTLIFLFSPILVLYIMQIQSIQRHTNPFYWILYLIITFTCFHFEIYTVILYQVCLAIDIFKLIISPVGISGVYYYL